MLEFRSVSKSFPGVRALRDVSFAIESGEVHALMGENGAGKSTLMNVLGGVFSDYEGEIFLDGQLLQFHNPHDAHRAGIAQIHQELQLVPELSIAENIFLGRELHTSLGMLDRRAMERESSRYLERLHLHIDPGRSVKGLRVGEQQLIEIAKALSLNARLLVLDEPTSALNQTEINFLFDVIGRLKTEGVTMIYISHKFEETFRIADRVTVMRDGEYIGTRQIRETTEDALIQMMVGRSIKELFPKQAITLGDEVLAVDNLTWHANERRGERSLHDLCFSVRSGEIVGVAGLLGAGRTELLETLFGVHPRRSTGTITLDGVEQHFRSPQDAIAAGIAFVTEDRKTQSLILMASVGDNITLAALRKFLRFGVVNHQQERKAVATSIAQLRIKTPSAATQVANLSGGNQQKVVMAKGLLTAPRLLLLDEPTRGIDVGAKAEIYTLITQLAQRGAAVLIASSEMPELLGMCDRILVLAEGRLTAELTRAEATQEGIMRAAMALKKDPLEDDPVAAAPAPPDNLDPQTQQSTRETLSS